MTKANQAAGLVFGLPGRWGNAKCDYPGGSGAVAYDENLAERIRVLLSDVPGVTERRMFGGLAFMVNGNMACGPVKDLLMVRVGKDQYGAALHEGPATEMTFTGRPMKGFVQIQTDALADDDVLADWVHRGVDFASSLPPKNGE